MNGIFKHIALSSPWVCAACVSLVAIMLLLGMCGGGKAFAAEQALATSQDQITTGTTPSNTSSQKKAVRLSPGLYEIHPRKAMRLSLNVNNSSIKKNANVNLHTKGSGNNQKFVVLPAGGGYYRIKMALGPTVLAVANASKRSGANVRMEARRDSSAQLWKPIATISGIALENKKSGKRLSFSNARSGANVRQSPKGTPDRYATWDFKKTKLNGTDEKSFLKAINAAPKNGLHLRNASGYKVNKKLWKRLSDSVKDCRASGAGIGFIMVDLCTGMTLSLNPDTTRFGASTIKGLYVTYLFEQQLETGKLSWNAIQSLAWPTVVRSDNDCYRALRARCGSEPGFRRWLASAGVGYISTWGDYSARTLAKAWTHMAGYAASKGRYVKTWKKLFNHSDHSFIHEALGGRGRSTYSKPGWMEVGTWSGTIMNDAGIVDDGEGNRCLMAFTSSVDPTSNRYQIRRVASALGAIHKDMTKKRGW